MVERGEKHRENRGGRRAERGEDCERDVDLGIYKCIKNIDREIGNTKEESYK